MSPDLGKLPPLTQPIKTAVNIDADRKSNAGWGPLKDAASTASGIELRKVQFQALVPVKNYLDSLDYGPILVGDRKTVYPWDCADRALWAIAHARHRFPGLPMAIAEGKGQVGAGIKGQDHAVVLLWWKKDQNTTDYVYYDPALKRYLTDKINDFGPIVRITAFPITKRDAPNNIQPLNLGSITDEIIGRSITMDEYINIYPLHTDDKKGVLDYLEGGMQDKSCVDLKSHQGASKNETDRYFMDTDRALWNKVHIRRNFPACPISVAIGMPVVDGGSKAVNMIWTDSTSKVIWDPKMNQVVNGFNVDASFM
jgi:hypothetical protein